MPAELLICVNRRFGGPKPSCGGRGSPAIADAFERALAERGLDVKVMRSPGQNTCERGPSVRLLPGPVLYLGVQLDEVPTIVDRIAEALDRARAKAEAAK
ncbi:MAG: (2Fe-2S) ferredoxin domain-containing protein [Proteobacteria bacterium]|nr:(2Fe-2S) ferredoxin domain-containing protein [Pseudomonadota bacterium]